MIQFASFRLDVEDQCLWRGSERVVLTPKAFSVLQYLVERAGRLVTQNELLEALWPGVYVQPEVLKSHILDIRHALGDDARNPIFVETQTKRGYRFIAAVHSSEPSHADSTVTREAGPGPGPDASIAVLPFANMSGDKDSEYFSDGLAEEIINALTKLPRLKVTARTSAFAFKGKNEDIRRIGETLGVANILEGSVRKADNRVRITAQLIAASDGSHLWSGRFDREIADIFAIQDEISQAIADALQMKLGRPVQRLATAKPPASPEAYQAYLEGRYHMYQMTPHGMDRSLECFERAIRLDPKYAPPYVGLAQRAYFQILYLSVRPREAAPSALTSLARALQLDFGFADAHIVRAIFSAFYEWNWRDAGEHSGWALELDPASARIRTTRSTWFLAPTGRLDEALAEVTRAVALDPLSPAVRGAELWILYAMRRTEAVERARAALQLFPAHWTMCFTSCYVFMQHGLNDEAATALEDGLKMVPGNVHMLAVLAQVRGRQGRVEAENIRAELEVLALRQYVPFCPRALASEACGDMDRAYDLLEQALEEREPLALLRVMAKNMEPGTDRRNHDLLRKINLA